VSVAYVVCPHCQAGNPSTATVCWMCRSALAGSDATLPMPVAPRAVAGPAARAPVPRSESMPIAWSSTLAVSVLLSLAIAAELARVAPGLLVLFLFVDLPVVGALLVTVVKMWAGGGPATHGDAARSVATGVAIGLAGVFTLLAALFLFAFAILVIAFVICLAIVFASQHP
jgi:hypothetical protein